MIKKVLIANRGEIACRIMKTAKELGMLTVAVYSESDRHALHVQMADEAIYLGVSLQETYLNADKIIAAAQQVQAEAIHPGYGFLAENYQFAQACQDAKIIFIGPSAQVIQLMGLKDAAKDVVGRLGLPLVPGYQGDNQDPVFLLQEAEKMGFPVLLKAAGGGGGKGMRKVLQASEFTDHLAAAKRESLASFGYDKIILEKYLANPRHIEIQIAADTLGNVVHLFERDCSIQRRYQKVIEEAPAYHLSVALKEKMYCAAINIAKAISYTGVGTIECLVEDDQFYFMEMNTRLQVEHPVTEFVTGQDLVAWQFKIASGEPLPLLQSQLRCQGFAIEARLCAEDPSKGYLPAAGQIQHLHWPRDIRIDTGVKEKDHVTMHYDSLLAKLIAYAPTRQAAISQLASAIDETEIIGITTNRLFLKKILALKAYQTGELSTQFIPAHATSLLQATDVHWEIVLPVACAFLLNEKSNVKTDNTNDIFSPWACLQGFQLNLPCESVFYFYHEGQMLTVTLTGEKPIVCSSTLFRQPVMLQEVEYQAETGRIQVLLNQELIQARVLKTENNLHIFCRGWQDILQLKSLYSFTEQGSDDACIRAPIPGNIVAILVQVGDVVQKGQPLVMMEAMKMEHTLSAPQNGTVQALHFGAKDQVGEGAEIMRLVFEDEIS